MQRCKSLRGGEGSRFVVEVVLGEDWYTKNRQGCWRYQLVAAVGTEKTRKAGGVKPPVQVDWRVSSFWVMTEEGIQFLSGEGYGACGSKDPRHGDADAD